MYYKLDDNGDAIECSADEWADWFQNRSVAGDHIVDKTRIGDVSVSTVFLGLDHSPNNDGTELFETMIFGGPNSDMMWRYSTLDEAIEGHDRAVLLSHG